MARHANPGQRKEGGIPLAFFFWTWAGVAGSPSVPLTVTRAPTAAPTGGSTILTTPWSAEDAQSTCRQRVAERRDIVQRGKERRKAGVAGGTQRSEGARNRGLMTTNGRAALRRGGGEVEGAISFWFRW